MKTKVVVLAENVGITQNQTNPPRRILVADDASDLRRLNAGTLKRSGCHVDTAEDGNADGKVLHAVSYSPDSYDLLTADCGLPGLSGLCLVKKPRAAHMALPVITATGRLLTEELAQNPSLQLAAVLPKPFSIAELLETVRAVLRANDNAHRQLEPLSDRQSQPGTAPSILNH